MFLGLELKLSKFSRDLIFPVCFAENREKMRKMHVYFFVLRNYWTPMKFFANCTFYCRSRQVNFIFMQKICSNRTVGRQKEVINAIICTKFRENAEENEEKVSRLAMNGYFLIAKPAIKYSSKRNNTFRKVQKTLMVKIYSKLTKRKPG